MTDLPEPLTAPECDLRDYPWMPLDVRRLLTSETWVLGSPEEKCAAVSLWCESWQQVPAGSLPENDRMLAHLSMAGAGWKRIRDEVLKSWVKCSDGRLYHPVVAEKAREAWAAKLAQKSRTEAARRAKAQRAAGKTAAGNSSPATGTVTRSVTENATEEVTTFDTESVTSSVTEDVTGSTVQDRTREDIREDSPSLRSGGARAARSTQRGARLAPDWRPSADEAEFARSLGLDPGQVAAKFRDYWHAKPGQAASKLDWTATWRNWCRTEADRQPMRRDPNAEGPMTRMAREARMRPIDDDFPMLGGLPN